MRPSGMVWPGASAPSLKSQHPSHRVLSWCILSLAYVGNILLHTGQQSLTGTYCASHCGKGGSSSHRDHPAFHWGRTVPLSLEAVLHYTGGKSCSWPQPCTCLALSTLMVREDPAYVLLEYGDRTFLWLGCRAAIPGSPCRGPRITVVEVVKVLPTLHGCPLSETPNGSPSDTSPALSKLFSPATTMPDFVLQAPDLHPAQLTLNNDPHLAPSFLAFWSL